MKNQTVPSESEVGVTKPNDKGHMVRVDSSLLLPSAARCLMKNVTRPSERDGWQIEEATEHDNETGTD
jgi:hypothetical protein